MKLQNASLREIKRIAIGTAAGDAILLAGLFLLSLVGVGSFRLLPILLGLAGGSAVAIANFTVMCLTVQKAVEFSDQKQMKAFFQGSYNGRLLLQAVWVIIALVVSGIHSWAGILPLLFPNATIYYLQLKGKLVAPSVRKTPAEPEEEDSEQPLGPFEV